MNTALVFTISTTVMSPKHMDGILRGYPKVGETWDTVPGSFYNKDGRQHLPAPISAYLETPTARKILEDTKNAIAQWMEYPSVMQQYRIDAIWHHTAMVRQLSHGPTHEATGTLFPKLSIPETTVVSLFVTNHPINSAHNKLTFIKTLPTWCLSNPPKDFIFNP